MEEEETGRGKQKTKKEHHDAYTHKHTTIYPDEDTVTHTEKGGEGGAWEGASSRRVHDTRTHTHTQNGKKEEKRCATGTRKERRHHPHIGRRRTVEGGQGMAARCGWTR